MDSLANGVGPNEKPHNAAPLFFYAICDPWKYLIDYAKKASEYDEEIPQSHTADQPTAHHEEEPHNNHKTPGRQIK